MRLGGGPFLLALEKKNIFYGGKINRRKVVGAAKISSQGEKYDM